MSDQSDTPETDKNLSYKAERDEARRQLAELQDQIVRQSDTRKPLRETSNKLT